MANENETVADIVAEMRQGMNPNGTAECQYLESDICTLADRIEAAWKREREELDKRISDLESYAKLWTDRADELRLKCDELYAKAKPVGNAAAMREALEKIYTCVDDCYNYDPESKLDEVIGIADAALSAPARNCDKMPDIDNPTMHDLAKSPCKSTLEYASREELLALVRWLLAPAAERKGEGDGHK